jgi:hypothetical protein
MKWTCENCKAINAEFAYNCHNCNCVRSQNAGRDKEYQDFIDRYRPTPVDKLKNDIRMARFTYIITDPYPKITEWEHTQRFKSYLEKKMDIVLKRDPKPDISTHRAFREGMEFMWKLIEPLTK